MRKLLKKSVVDQRTAVIFIIVMLCSTLLNVSPVWFVVISALFARQYPTCTDRYLPLGGALAYGHPYGCSGAVLVLHALASLEGQEGKRALCAIAGAGGTGAGVLLETL